MTFTPNRIVLISRGRHEEAVAGGVIYPGMVLNRGAGGIWYPHNLIGQATPVAVATEDALRGGDITQPLGPAGFTFPYRLAAKGDEYLFLLQNGQNVGDNTDLMSAGDGTLIASPTGPLFQGGLSTVNTATSAETSFSTSTYTLPANTFLEAGDVLRLAGQAVILGQHLTDTTRVRVYLGVIATQLVDFTALNLPVGTVFEWGLEITCNVIGATGKITGTGTYTYVNGTSGQVVEQTFALTSTTIDTTATQAIKATSTFSSANAGNQIQGNNFLVSMDRETAYEPMVRSLEAINNSAGTGTSGFDNAAFIRGLVL